MRTSLRGLGYAAFFGAGLVIYIFEVIWFYRWWDILGAIVGAVAAPLAAVFPFIFLVKEGFSALYFGLWAVGIVGVILAAAAGDD